MKEKILAREKECFEFLNSIPKDVEYVVIGGYAVSSFQFPRLSVDMDIVIPKTEIKNFEKILKEKKYVISAEKSDFDDTYSGEFRKYEKKVELPVSVDLLIKSVKSRQSNFSYSFEYLYKNSEIREVVGWNPELISRVRVADKEMLIALKINSMRLADKRDIIALCYEKPDAEKIAKHLSNVSRDIIKRHLSELIKLLENPKYTDSIKGVFMIDDKTYDRIIKNSKRTVKELQDLLF